MTMDESIKTAGKIPELNTENFMVYEVLLVAWLKRFHSSDRALREDAPTFKVEDYAHTLDEDGEDTEETTVLREVHNESYRMWQKRNDIAYSSIVESCQHNPTAMLLILETQSTVAKILWDAIVKKFNLQHLAIKQRELARFNSLMIQEGENLTKFVDRLKQGKLNLKNLGYEIDDNVELLGRLKTGISRDKRYTHIVSNLTFNDFTWEEAVNRIDLIGSLDGINNEIVEPTKESTDKTKETAQYTGNQNNKFNKRKANKYNKNNQKVNKTFKSYHTNSANSKDTNQSQFQGNCNFCGKYGHKEGDCRIKARVVRSGTTKLQSTISKNQGSGSGEKRKKCHVCDTTDHWTSDCLLVKDAKNKKNRNNEIEHPDYEYGAMTQEYDTRSTSSKKSKPHEGIMDSGATSHLLKRSTVGDAEVDEECIRIGTALNGATLEGDGRTDIGHLEESIVVNDEDLAMNLISVGKLDSNGLTIIFKGGACRVIDETKNTVIARGILRDGQYFVDIRDFKNRETALLASVAPPISDILWHNRLGHIHHRKICNAVSKHLISGIKYPLRNTSRHSPLCSACASAKSTKITIRLKKNSKSDSSNRKSTPTTANSDDGSNEECDADTPTIKYSDESDQEEGSEPIHLDNAHLPSPLRKQISCISTDIKGPLRVAGRNGEHYYQGFIETDTKYLYSFGMATKDLALKNIGNLMDLQLSAMGQQLIRYHCDGAHELISSKIVQLLADRGCTVSYSPPYEPRGNAIKERNHRTLFESAHAMMNACGLNMSFWFMAIEYATLIYNKMPTTTKYGYMSPTQAKFGVIPNVKRFKKFGCVAYIHIPSSTREKGFVDKTYKGYFVGLDLMTSSYKIYVIELDQIKISASVIFDEVTVIQRQIAAEFLIDPEPRPINDFNYLIGMVYCDDEDGMKYVTTRVVKQRGIIVSYRAPYSHDGAVGSEETRPVHVADAALLVAKYQTEHPPVVLDGNHRLPIVGVRDIDDPVATRPPLRSSGTAVIAGRDTGINDEPDGVSGGTAPISLNLSTLAGGVAQATPVEAGTGPDQPMERAPRLRNRPRTIINVGKLGDVTHMTNITYNNHEYVYYMSNFNYSDEHAFAGVPTDPYTTLQPDPWLESSLEELKSIVLVHNCWDCLLPPTNCPYITLKWVHTHKNDGRRKSRLVARGFNQKHGVNYFETSSPTAKMATIRILLSLIAILRMYPDILDVKTAFLNAKMDEEVWVKPPNELDNLYVHLIPLVNPQQRHQLKYQLKRLREGSWLRLRKSLYGTKQASRNWYIMLNDFLISQGFKRNLSEPCLYTKVSTDDITFILVYVDDIIIASTDMMLTRGTVDLLSTRFQVTRKGGLSQFLNIDLVHNRNLQTVTMCQRRYIEAVFETFREQITIPLRSDIHSPMLENFKIVITEEELANGLGKNSSDNYVKNFPYQELLGSLLFLAVCTRPILAYPISYLAKFAQKYNKQACNGLIRMLQYVHNTRFDVLTLGGVSIPRLVGYCDSDFAGCLTTRKSTSGSILFLGHGPIVWFSKLQTIVAQSTAEAEYLALYPICQNIIWTRNMFHDFNFVRLRIIFSTTIWVDNMAAIEVVKSDVLNSRLKHIALKTALIKELYRIGIITPDYVDTKNNLADIFTKAVSLPVFRHLAQKCMGRVTEIPYSLKRIKTLKNDDYF
jgi:hypothetical protein